MKYLNLPIGIFARLNLLTDSQVKKKCYSNEQRQTTVCGIQFKTEILCINSTKFIKRQRKPFAVQMYWNCWCVAEPFVTERDGHRHRHTIQLA